MNIESNKQYIIYTNIFNLLKFRGQTHKKDSTLTNLFNSLNVNEETILTFSEFTNQFNINEQIIVNSNKSPLTIILFSVNSKHLKSNALESFMKKTGFTNHTIFIVDKESTSKFIINFIKKRKEAKDDVPKYEIGIYNYLLYDFPNHILFTKYRKVPKDELNKFLEIEKIDASKLPRIVPNMNTFWYGFKYGQYVEEILPSESTGEVSKYKIIK